MTYGQNWRSQRLSSAGVGEGDMNELDGVLNEWSEPKYKKVDLYGVHLMRQQWNNGTNTRI